MISFAVSLHLFKTISLISNAAKKNLSRKGIVGEAQYYLFYDWHKFVTIAVSVVVLALAIGIPVGLKIKTDKVIEREQEIAKDNETEKAALALPTVRAENARNKAIDVYEKKGGLAGRAEYLRAIEEAEPDDLEYITLLTSNFILDDKNYNGDPEFLIPYAIEAFERNKNYTNAIMVSRLYRESGEEELAEEYAQIASGLVVDEGMKEFNKGFI